MFPIVGIPAIDSTKTDVIKSGGITIIPMDRIAGINIKISYIQKISVSADRFMRLGRSKVREF